MRRWTLLLPIALIPHVVAQAAIAQTVQIPKGAKIRVSFPTNASRRFVGIVDTVRSDTIVVDIGVQRFAISAADPSSLEISRGRKRPTWSKLAPLWLTAAGAGVGALAGYSTEPRDSYFGRGFAAAAVGTLGGLVGLVVGTGMAIGVKTDVWEHVGRPGSDAAFIPSVYVAPSSGAVGVGLRASF